MDRRLAGRSADWLVLVYALYAFVACALLSVNMPPFQNADELNHFLRADSVSRGALLGQRFGEVNSGGVASPGISRAAAPFEALKFRPDLKATSAMYAAARAHWDEPGMPTHFPNTAIYPPTFYAPSVAAIWVGKASRMSVVQTLYLARILTGVASSLGICWALLICCRAGLTGAALLIFAVAVLPMSLAVQNACSQDGLMLAAAALAASWFARLQRRPEPGGFAAMCVCLALLAMARPPYIALALLPLATPTRWRARLLGTGLVVVSCLAWTEFSSAYVSVYALPAYEARIASQFRLLLDPARDFQLAVTTLRLNGPEYLTQFVGTLGWLDVSLPRALIRAELALLCLVAVASLASGRPDRRQSGGAVLTIAVLLSAAGIFAVQYLTWTEPGALAIDGVQGRYFLPLALMLGGLSATVRRGVLGSTAAASAAILPVAAIGATIRAIVVRYYIGP